MNCMHLMDVIDPYPLVLRRPQPPSQADIWMDEEFKVLRSQRATKPPPWEEMHKEHRELTKEELLKGSGAKKWEGSWDAPIWRDCLTNPPTRRGVYEVRRRPGLPPLLDHLRRWDGCWFSWAGQKIRDDVLSNREWKFA